jgi:hypothetical protein
MGRCPRRSARRTGRLSGGGARRYRIDGDVAATQLRREDAGKCDDGRLPPDRGPGSSRSFRAFLSARCVRAQCCRLTWAAHVRACSCMRRSRLRGIPVSGLGGRWRLSRYPRRMATRARSCPVKRARTSRTGKPPANVLAALMMRAAGAPVKLSLCCRPAPPVQLPHCRTRGCPGKAAFPLAAPAPGPCRPHMTSAAPP